MPTEGRETEGGRYRRPGAMPRLPVEEDGVYSGVSDLFLYYYYYFANDFLREGRQVCRACATAKWWCPIAGGDTIKMSWKKMEDMEEGWEEVEEEGGGGDRG